MRIDSLLNMNDGLMDTMTGPATNNKATTTTFGPNHLDLGTPKQFDLNSSTPRTVNTPTAVETEGYQLYSPYRERSTSSSSSSFSAPQPSTPATSPDEQNVVLPPFMDFVRQQRAESVPSNPRHTYPTYYAAGQPDALRQFADVAIESGRKDLAAAASNNNIDPVLGDDTPLFRGISHSNSNSPSPPPQAEEPTSPTAATVAPVLECSYCDVCTTGSPLRKVVSHIFGRNKLSTRQIPKTVWVYYCRKHYQRSRYRNPHGFARQQVLLVRRQCERLEQWGGVKDWIIKVRRREEMRSTGESESGWLTQFTGKDKTIQDIYTLLDEIEEKVKEKNDGKFPDVELLPNVDLDLVEKEDVAAAAAAAEQTQQQQPKKKRTRCVGAAAAGESSKRSRKSAVPVTPPRSSGSPE